MLQLPESAMSGRRFSKAHLADMARGATVTIRAVKPKRDRIALDLVVFGRLVSERAKAEAIADRAKSILEKSGAVSPMVRVDDTWDRTALIGSGGPFHTADRIAERIRQSKQQHRQALATIRKRPRYHRTGPYHAIMRERDEMIAFHKKCLEHLPALEAKLLRQLRDETRRVKTIQRNVGWIKKHKAYSRAHARMWTVFTRMTESEITSRDGALALIALAGIVIKTRVIYPGELPAVLARATNFLFEQRSV